MIVRTVVSFGAGIVYAVIVAAAAVARGTSVDAALAPRGSAYSMSTFLIGFTAGVVYHAVAEGIGGGRRGASWCAGCG